MVHHDPVDRLADPQVRGRNLQASPEDLGEGIKTGVEPPDHVLLRDPDVVEKGLPVRVEAETHFIVHLPVSDAGKVGRHEKGRRALADRQARVGPGVDEQELRIAHQGVEALRPVQDIEVAVRNRRQSHPRPRCVVREDIVASRVRFGHQDRCRIIVIGGKLPEELLLLVLGSRLDDHLGDLPALAHDLGGSRFHLAHRHEQERFRDHVRFSPRRIPSGGPVS